MISLRRTTLPAALALLACLVFAQFSDAYWTNSGTGTGTAATATMPGGTAPTASVAGTTVTVSIPQISVAGQLVGVLGGGYTVKRYPGTGGTGVTIPSGTCSTSVTGTAATLNCTETSTPRGDWRYTVSPTLFQWTTTESASSATVNVLPDPASGLTATQIPAADIRLDWTAGPGATGYNIYRRTTAGAYNFATPLNGATPVTGTTYTDTTPVSGTSYNYVIRSVVIGSVGQQLASGNSNETAAVVADGTVPTAVTLGAIPATLSGDVTFTGSASDTISGMESMDFEYRTSPSGAWTNACTETTTPYDCDFDTTSVADGLYDFRTVAFDVAGNQTASTIQTNRRIDNTDPTVTLNAVAAFVRGTITVGGTASDAGSGLASLTLNIRAVGAPTWTTLCTGATSPRSCSLNTTTYAAGQYELQLVATDVAGNVATDADAPFTIDNNGPVTTMTNPGSPLSGVELLESTVSDAGSGVASVQYQYKLSAGTTWTNACLSSATPFSCNWNTASVADGSYDFRAIATDALGTTTTSATITARVIDNTAPSAVTMTNPGTPLRATVTLNATATDTGGGIANVAIQRSPAGLNTWTTICADTTTPYSCSFDTTTVTDGSYDFRAVATDNASNTLTSAVVAARVIDNTAPAVTLTNPGNPIRATVTLNATSTDTGGSGVANVAFQYKLSTGTTWTTIATDTTTPYSANFATAALNGTYDIRALSTDIAGNQGTSTFTNVVIDNTVPTAVDIQTTNGGAVAGRPDAGDVITFTFSEPMRPASILAGWTGASTAVFVRLSNGGTDRLRVRNPGNTANLPFGSVRIGTAWVTATANFNATMVMVGNTIVVTLGTQTSGTVATSNTTYNMLWSPSATALDVAGNAMSTTTRTETGAADREF